MASRFLLLVLNFTMLLLVLGQQAILLAMAEVDTLRQFSIMVI